MKETRNSWIVRSAEQIEQNMRYSNKRGIMKYDKARFNVYLCVECDRVYEQNVFTNDGAKIYFYKDFPTYKLKRKECFYCKNESK